MFGNCKLRKIMGTKGVRFAKIGGFSKFLKFFCKINIKVIQI